MINGKHKAITFSFDDGVFQDKRVIDYLNESGLKGTFNLNSGLFNHRHPTIYNHITVLEEDVAEIYKGHEVAVHGYKHPNLNDLNKDEIIFQVEQDRKNLEKLVGYKVVGMAYPFRRPNDSACEIIKENTGVEYARCANSKYNFDIEKIDGISFVPTCHINDEKTFELLEQFKNLETDKDICFYLWAHSYEFDHTDTWGRFHDLCKKIGKLDDVAFVTNREVYGNKNG